MKIVVRARPESPPLIAPRAGRMEIALAVAAFAVLSVVVLRIAPQLVEPDDYAYRASIVGITDGHLLTLSTAQVHALANQLTPGAGQGNALVAGPQPHLPGIAQWSPLADGRWISEKEPGYPLMAAPFQLLGIIRLAPLFYGALACLGLLAGPDAGSASWAARRRSGCSAHPARRCCSPGVTTCPPAPTPRLSRRGPARCCGQCPPTPRHSISASSPSVPGTWRRAVIGPAARSA